MRGRLQIIVLMASASALHAWTPGTASPAASSGFTVDTSDRNDVVSFWHGAYSPSEFYWDRIAWTGNYGSTANGAEGTTSAAFVDDVERRINFVRALCGVPANISMNTNATVLIESGDAYQPSTSTTKRSAVQRSALVVALGSTGDAISHTPPSNLSGWTTAAWNGHNKSTISKGFYGPGAIDAYFREDVTGVSNWNYDVGHRRWLLAVPVTDMATGDTPGSFNPSTYQIVQPSNLVYVKPKPGELSSAPGRFVSYPGAGYFPVGLNSPFWSLSRDGADFSSATVSMTDSSGVSVPVTVVSRRTGYAENAIVWSVPNAVKSTSAPVDRTYHITVSGIGGGVASSHSWSVTLIDPNRLSAPVVISGPATAVSSGATNFTINPVPGCDKMQTGFFLKEGAAWTETAENGSDLMIVDRTSSAYELRASVSQSAPGYPSNYYTQGSKAFRLTFPTAYDPRLNSIADEIFELDREILPGASANVKFQFRRGYMSSNTALSCESSSDGGLSWQAVGNPLTGAGNGQADTSFSLVSLPLSQSSNPVRLRFRLHRTDPSAGIFTHEAYPNYATGAFIDELRVDGCEWLKPGGLVETTPSQTSVVFGPSTTTVSLSIGQQWTLKTRPMMGAFTFPWGSAKLVQVTGPLGIDGPIEPPVSGAVYTFIPDPSAQSHVFEVARFSPGNWSEGAETEPLPTVIDGTSSAYSLVSNRTGYRASGSSSFRLAVQPSDGEDYFEINREVVATGSSQLSFWLRRGWSKNQQLDAEVSVNGGASWQSAWSIGGLNFGEGSGETYQVDLSSYSGSAIRCRFVLRSTGSVTFNATNSGMWLDEVGMTNVEEIFASAATTVAHGSNSVTFNASTAGETPIEGAVYRLRMRPVTAGVSGQPGPSYFVTPSGVALSGYEAWVAFEHPSITGGFEDADGDDGVANGIKYAFGIDPESSGITGNEVSFDSDYLILERQLDNLRDGVVYEAEFSNNLNSWSSSGVNVTHVGGVLRATANRPASGPGFLRWKVTEE